MSKKIIFSLILVASVANADFFTDVKKWALEAVPEKNSDLKSEPDNQKSILTTYNEKPVDSASEVHNNEKPLATEDSKPKPQIATTAPVQPIDIEGKALVTKESNMAMILERQENAKKIVSVIEQRAPSVTEVDVSDKLPIEFVNTYGYKVAKANPDSYVINEDSQISFNPVLNDIFYEADDYKVIDMDQVKNASIKMKGNEITVIPNSNFHGNINFEYVIASKDNKTLTSDISIEVMPINDRPVAKDDLVLMQEDTEMLLPSLIQNDTDADNDNLRVIRVSEPSNGTLEEDAGVWIYTPNPDFHGMDKISYVIRDEAGATDEGLVTMVVKGVNDNPKATDDTYTLNEDSKLKISDFLSNDVDVDGDLFHMTSHTNPSYGSIAFNGKSLIYTPENDFNGKDYFYYTIADTKRNTAKGKISLVVTPQNDEPITNSDGPFITEVSKPIYITSAMDNDSDIDGDELSISTYTRPINGEVSFDENQTFIYIPNPGFIGIDRFTYTVTDGQNTSDVSSIEIQVKEKQISKSETERQSKKDEPDDEVSDAEASEANDVLNAIKNF